MRLSDDESNASRGSTRYYTYLMEGLNEERTRFNVATKRIEFRTDDWDNVFKTVSRLRFNKLWLMCEDRDMVEMTEDSFVDAMQRGSPFRRGYKGQYRLPFDIGAEQEALEGNCTPGNEISTPTPAEIDAPPKQDEVEKPPFCSMTDY